MPDPSWDWQTLTAIGIVMLAALAMVPRIFRLLFSKSFEKSCGGCAGCSSKTQSPSSLPIANIQIKRPQ